MKNIAALYLVVMTWMKNCRSTVSKMKYRHLFFCFCHSTHPSIAEFQVVVMDDNDMEDMFNELITPNDIPQIDLQLAPMFING